MKIKWLENGNAYKSFLRLLKLFLSSEQNTESRA